MSHNLLGREVLPQLAQGEKVALFVIDCFRYEEFLSLAKGLPTELRVESKEYMGILPSATAYARNALFGGLLPREIHARHPGWLSDNRHERELLAEHLARRGIQVDFTFRKLNTFQDVKGLRVGERPFEVFIVNLVDLMFHLRHELDILRALGDSVDSLLHWGDFVVAESELAFRITEAAERDYTVFVTTDHGWVMGKEPLVVHGGGELTPGLRYKFGDSVRIVEGDGVMIKELAEWGLPSIPGARRLVMATGYSFIVYSSDPRKYERTYRGGVFHGGITLEEMVLPLLKISR